MGFPDDLHVLLEGDDTSTQVTVQSESASEGPISGSIQHESKGWSASSRREGPSMRPSLLIHEHHIDPESTTMEGDQFQPVDSMTGGRDAEDRT